VTALRPYLDVLHLPGGRVLLGVGILSRLGLGMTPLALLLLVQQASGRYAAAGLAAGIYAVAAAALSPVGGRLADRLGPAPILLTAAVLHPLALAGLVLAARSGGNALSWILVMSGAAGATYPPLTAAIRRAWTDLTDAGTGRQHLRGAALAAETSLFELVFVLGPVLVSAIVVVTGGPAGALLGVALVTLVGTAWLAALPVMRRRHAHEPGHRATGLGPLRAEGFGALMVGVLALGITFGAIGVAIPAFVNRHGGGDELGGLLLGVCGVGSAIGGIWFGTRRPAMALPRQLAWSLAGVSLGLLLAAGMPNPLWLAVALVLGGAAIAPALTVENNLVSRLAPAAMLNEAYTWVVTVSVAGTAAGGAVAGVIVDLPGGLPWAFAFPAGVTAVAALVAAQPSGPMIRADRRAAEVALPRTQAPVGE
jgi:MFS family permease